MGVALRLFKFREYFYSRVFKFAKLSTNKVAKHMYWKGPVVCTLKVFTMVLSLLLSLQLEVEVNELRDKLSKQTQGTPDNSLLR